MLLYIVLNSELVFVAKCPAKFTMPASDGDDTLVPPKTNHPLNPWQEVLS